MNYLLLILVCLLAHYVHDRVQLRRYLMGLNISSRATQTVALEVAGHLYHCVHRRADPYYLLPMFGIFGPTAVQVIRQGGCCSGITRLYISLLHELGVRASQITLYHRDGRGSHCLAEIQIDGTLIAVDPTYGFWYCNEAGDPLGLASLRRGELPHFRSLPGTRTSRYPDNPYYDWVYSDTKTISWTHSRGRKAAYATLRFFAGDKIDELRLHPALEWPQVLVAVSIVLFIFAFRFAAFMGG